MSDDNVNHPKHYTSHKSGIEAIEICQHFSFCLGNAIKYIIRADHKGSKLDDWKKSRWYLARAVSRGEHLGPGRNDAPWQTFLLVEERPAVKAVFEAIFLGGIDGVVKAHEIVDAEIKRMETSDE